MVLIFSIFNNKGNSAICHSYPCKKTGTSEILAERSGRGHRTGPGAKTLRPEELSTDGSRRHGNTALHLPCPGSSTSCHFTIHNHWWILCGEGHSGNFMQKY